MDVNMFIACCGLDCEKCEARLATINNDDKLKKRLLRFVSFKSLVISTIMVVARITQTTALT